MPSPEIIIEHSITAWSKALVMHHDTLRGKLDKSGVPKSDLYTARQIFQALHGEKDASVIRNNNAKAEQLEKENRVRDGELVEIPKAERMLWLELLFPLKQEIDLMPEKLSPLLTGDDAGRVTVLRDWWEETKRKLLKEAKL